MCHQIHEAYTNTNTIPFIDGKVSVSLIGRQVYTIKIFKPLFLLYGVVSAIFYIKFANWLKKNGVKNKFKLYGILATIFLFIYIFALGNNDRSYYEIIRRLAIILFIIIMYINHFLLTRKLKKLNNENKIEFNKIYLIIFYTIIFLMTLLIIIGSPWINPLFNYPDQLKNIVEWNYFLLVIGFYIPLSLIFFKYERRLKK